MNRLHAIWWARKLHLWGERSHDEEPAEGAPSTATNAPDEALAAPHPDRPAPHPDLHPDAMPPQALHAAVGDLSPDGLLASIADESTLDLWLPCVGERPIASHDAPPDAGPSADDVQLRRMTVPTLAFAGDDAIDLLTSLPANLLRNCRDSLQYWAQLARAVLKLLARKQFVPEILNHNNGHFSAAWRLFATDKDESLSLEHYAGLMPPICRAVVSTDATETLGTSLVDSFMTEAADAIIRRDLANDEFFMQIHSRAKKEPCWELHWLAGLIGDDADVHGDTEENASVTAEIRAWLGKLDEGEPVSPPRLGFRLIEPEDEPAPGEAGWLVQLELRDRETGEPLDIRRVWQEPTSAAPTILGRRHVDHREHLLSDLTRAAQVFPELKDTEGENPPADVRLTTANAHAFLREWGPLLAAQGFGVTLPDWATEMSNRLGMKLFVRPQDEGTPDADAPRERKVELSLGSFGLSSLLEFDWRVAVGDEQLSPEEFQRVASQESSLVKIRGRWVDIDQRAAEQALDFMQKQPSGKISLVDALRIASGAEELEAGLPIIGLSGTSWIEQLLRESPEMQLQEVEQPEDFNGELRPYQQRGVEWLAFLDRLGIGACLADDMGLGKTIQLIALLLIERKANPDVGPTLLLVPMSLIGNWAREIQRFATTLKPLVHHGPDRLTGEGFLKATKEHDVVITTYGLAHRELKTLNKVHWHRIALDEAQKIKNPSANQTIAVRSLRAPHRLALTGTPLENHLSELWSIIEMLNPGLLGSAGAFRKKFAIPIEKFGNQERAEQLRRLIRPFILRRLKTDPDVACDLPEKMEMRIFCNLTPEQATYYNKVVNELMGEVDSASGIRRRGLILAALTKLKQVCNHPAHFLRTSGNLDRRSGKCERLVEMLEEVIDEGDAALVFTQFREMGTLLQRMLGERLGLDVLFLHGGTPSASREAMIRQFQDTSNNNRVFILSLRAGGFGLNLTRANHVFHFDRWWNPAVENQATDRVHRIGQTRKVQVHKFVCGGTIEERIDRVLTEKAALADRIVGSGDEWLTGLSTAELCEHLKLSRDAVAETF